MANVSSTDSRAHALALSQVAGLRKRYAIDVLLFVSAASGSTWSITFRQVPDYLCKSSAPQVRELLERLKPAD